MYEVKIWEFGVLEFFFFFLEIEEECLYFCEIDCINLD